MHKLLDQINFDEGLIPAIVQENGTKEVLMLAYMNKESLEKTLETRKAHYFSRSRQKLWLKGETSGHFQLVKNVSYDCDADTILLTVEQIGNACHTDNHSCFYRSENSENADSQKLTKSINSTMELETLCEIIRDRCENPVDGSYTNYLFEKGIDKMLKKVGEETSEVIIAAKNNCSDEIIYETADLMYHLSVVLVKTGVSWQDVFKALDTRKS